MRKLNYELLEGLVTHGRPLEVTDIDVKRLRDDRSEIHAGQEIAFVATASFRLTAAGCRTLQQQLDAGHLAVGDELLAIGPDADLHSDKLLIDDDSVARWIAHRYVFEFVLNGKPSAAFHDVGLVTVKLDDSGTASGELALPWIKKLDTIQVKDDYVDVDVQIRERLVTSHPVPRPTAERWEIDKRQIHVGPQGARVLDVELAFELDDLATLPATVKHKTFRVGLQADDDDDARFDLIVTITEPAVASKKPAPPRLKTSPKHRT